MTQQDKPSHACLKASALLISASLIGCSTIKVDVPASSVTVPKVFSATSAADAKPSENDRNAAPWWRASRDEQLISLVEDALRHNPDLRVARAHIAEARANNIMAESALYPTVDLNATAMRSRVADQRLPDTYSPGMTPVGYIPPVPVPAIPVTSFSGAGFTAAWEADVFGGRQSDATAAREMSLASEEWLHGAQVLVSTAVSQNYFEAQGAAQRIDLLDQSMASTRNLLRYVNGRFAAGQATRADQEQVKSQLDALASQRDTLALLYNSRLRQIAVLTGRPPEALPAIRPVGDARIEPLPLPPSQLPSEVLEQRPDVRLAAHLVSAQAARLGSAKTDRLPRFMLGFAAENGHLQVSGQPGVGGIFNTFGVGVTLPLFNAGRIKANIAANDARLEGAAARYDQTVLTALEDVENAYNARSALDTQVALLTKSANSAKEAATAGRAQFKEGQVLLQTALQRELDALQARDRLVQSETARAVASVWLIKALGGGWKSL